MKFNRDKLVVHRIFFSRPKAVFDLGSIGRVAGSHRKKRALVPERQVCSAGQWRALGESSNLAVLPGAL